MKAEKLYKKLQEFCKDNNVTESKVGFLMGLFMSHHQSKLQALKEVDIEKIAEQEALGATAEDNFIHGAKYILNLITNPEE